MEIEDKLSFLDGKDTSAQPAPDNSAPAQPSPDQPRDEHGKFAPKANDPAPAAAAVPVPQPAPTPAPVPAPVEPRHEPVPLATFLDVRDKLKAAEKRLSEIDQRPQHPQPVPSASADPEGYAAYLENIANSTRINTRFEMSEALAREKHTEEVVQGAMDWAMEQAKTSPAFAAEYLQQRHPIDWAVKQQKRHTLLATIGDDPEAYIAAEIARRAAAPAFSPAQPATPAAAPSQQVVQPAPAPAAPRSLANAPTAGSQHHVPSHPGAAFEATFNR